MTDSEEHLEGVAAERDALRAANAALAAEWDTVIRACQDLTARCEDLEADLSKAVDAVESMVTQFLYTDRPGDYDAECLSAGEEACEILATLRPQEWEATRVGVRRRDPKEPT